MSNWNPLTRWLVPDRFQPEQDDDRAVPTFPNGDYYIVLTEDMANGTFGHPWSARLVVLAPCQPTQR